MNAEQYRQYERERKQRYRQRTGKGTVHRPFIGVDGEGGNIGTRHEYLLLTAGEKILTTGKPLTPIECFTFLSGLDSNVCYVAYFFDYDVTMMARDMPEERIRRLLDRESRLSRDGRWHFPVDWEGFQIDYIPHKEFRIRRGKSNPWVVVNDVGSFFQCAFVKSLDEWQIGSPEDRQKIAEGKEQRAEFGALKRETMDYNALEIVMLQELMTRFRDVCREVGYVPSRWQGPGNMASAMLRHHGHPSKKTLDLSHGLIEAANAAYYGGRFETTAVGPVEGPIYEYDINSAYPDAMRSLPCLLHGEWSQQKGGVPDADIHLSRVHFYPTDDAMLYHFPVRSKVGTIFFPAEGNGWYWSTELGSAIHQGFDVQESWVYERHCHCRPFDWITPIYRRRQELGKTTKGRVLKLGLNSLYGKMAQSIGAAPYANPVYAGLITSMTREKLGNAAHDGPTCCDDVFMLATDALFVGSPRNVRASKELGDWDDKTHPSMFIVQPGLYFLDGSTTPKTRGLPRQAALDAQDEFRKAYASMCVSGDVYRHGNVPISLRQFTGLRIAVVRNALHTAGLWDKVTKNISFEWTGKRDPQKTAYQGLTLRTFPQAGGPDLESVPYSKDIGRLLEMARLDVADQPDWADVPFGEDL